MNTDDVFDAIATSAVSQFLSQECPGVFLPLNPDLATVGRLGPDKPSARFQVELDRAGVIYSTYQPFHDIETFVSNPTWQVGQAWSPFKQEILKHCDQLSLDAERTGVVDAVVRNSNKMIGLNTNLLSAMVSIGHLCGDSTPNRVLLFGNGAMGRCAVFGLQRKYQCEIGVVGRDAGNVKRFADLLPGVEVVGDAARFAPDLVINSTTVGEVGDGVLEFSVHGLWQPGLKFFDFNQDVNNLQRDALSMGVTVLSGVLMQRLAYAMRVSLLSNR